jgi:hypothetical protein
VGLSEGPRDDGEPVHGPSPGLPVASGGGMGVGAPVLRLNAARPTGALYEWASSAYNKAPLSAVIIIYHRLAVLRPGGVFHEAGPEA